jgi:isoleucyl-tRNA synthetase
MLRWMAPFLSFTAEEAWKSFGTSESIFLENFSDLGTPDQAVLDKWAQIRAVRDVVNKHIESVRTEGALGASLQANITLWAEGGLLKTLEEIGPDLKFLLITSTAEVRPYAEEEVKNAKASGPTHVGQHISETSLGEGYMGRLWTLVKPSEAAKCERCWHYCDDVGHNDTHPTLCGRCISNLDLAEETRKVA